MYEAGKRDLPTDALVKLSAITLFLDGLTENKKEETLFLNEQEIEFNTVLTRHTKELEYKLIKEQRVLEAIVKKLSDSKQVELEEKVDKDLIGGFILNVGDRQIDASIKSKLKVLKVKFAQNPYLAEIKTN